MTQNKQTIYKVQVLSRFGHWIYFDEETEIKNFEQAILVHRRGEKQHGKARIVKTTNEFYTQIPAIA